MLDLSRLSNRKEKEEAEDGPLWGATAIALPESHANRIRKITANVHKLPPTCRNKVEIARNGFLVFFYHNLKYIYKIVCNVLTQKGNAVVLKPFPLFIK